MIPISKNNLIGRRPEGEKMSLAEDRPSRNPIGRKPKIKRTDV